MSRETSITSSLPLSHLFYLSSPLPIPPFTSLFSLIQHLTYSCLSLPGFSLNISIHTCQFLFYLTFAFTLSLSFSGISLMGTGKWGTNNTLNPRHRKSLSFGINVHTNTHLMHITLAGIQVCVSMTASWWIWKYPRKTCPDWFEYTSVLLLFLVLMQFALLPRWHIL